jgi:hypothetical protein
MNRNIYIIGVGIVIILLLIWQTREGFNPLQLSRNKPSYCPRKGCSQFLYPDMYNPRENCSDPFKWGTLYSTGRCPHPFKN